MRTIHARKGRGRSRKDRRRAQISLEYLSIVGLSFLLLIPMIIIFYEQSGSLKDEIDAAQIEKAALELIGAAEEVYYLGEPSQKHLSLYFPASVESVTVEDDHLLITYATISGTADYTTYTPLPLNLSGVIDAYPGQHRLLVQAHDEGITIIEAS